MIATYEPIPQDVNARLKNAKTVIFEAIRRTAQEEQHEKLRWLGRKNYYYVDHSIPSQHRGLDGRIQMGVITSVDFRKRDKIVVDIERAMQHEGIGSEKLKVLCKLYNQVRSLAGEPMTRERYNQLVEVREQLKQQVNGVNTIF